MNIFGISRSIDSSHSTIFHVYVEPRIENELFNQYKCRKGHSLTAFCRHSLNALLATARLSELGMPV